MKWFFKKKKESTPVVSKEVKQRLDGMHRLTTYSARCILRAIASRNLGHIDSTILENVLDRLLLLETSLSTENQTITNSYLNMIKSGEWEDFIKESSPLESVENDIDPHGLLDIYSIEEGLKDMGVEIEQGVPKSFAEIEVTKPALEDLAAMNSAISHQSADDLLHKRHIDISHSLSDCCGYDSSGDQGSSSADSGSSCCGDCSCD